MNIIIKKDHNNIKELIRGTSSKAIFITVLGKKFQTLFKKYCLDSFKKYCKKHNLGLIVLNDLIVEKQNLLPPFDKNPNLHRLLIPKEIKRLYPRYKYLADIDADCLPTSIARNIFDYAKFKNEKEKKIYLVSPRPSNFSKEMIGKRLSLLRREYLNKKFPLDSILSGSEEDIKKIFKLRFKGPLATIGTFVAPSKVLIECYEKIISKIIKNSKTYIYLQNYTNETFRTFAKIFWLPYEFQAIWDYEVAINYPFLMKKINNNYLLKTCIDATMSKVDMLHFAGSWPPNDVFKDRILKQNNKDISKYYKKLPKFLNKKLKIKSYGKIKFNKSN